VTRVFVGSNYFGAGNFGDDLTMAGFLEAAARHPGIEISACAPFETGGERHRFPRVRWLPETEAIRESAVRAADAWLALGDTPFQLDSGSWSLDQLDRERARCERLGTPMYFLGVGSESTEAASDVRARALLSGAKHVWTRDVATVEMLSPFIAAERLSAGADLAHLAFSPDVLPNVEADSVGLLLAFENREQFTLDAIEELVRMQGSEQVRWLIQEVRQFEFVERWILDRIDASVRERLTIAEVDYARATTDEYVRAFGAPAVAVTSRYHGALVAAWQGSRIVVVARSEKLRGIADEFDVLCVPDFTSPADIADAMSNSRAVPRERLLESRARAAAMCEAFFLALDHAIV
jgi:polysaccharide pyruvyl transferase WcaK-like protein